MAGEKTFLRVPPDSTGKRVRVDHVARIDYQSKAANAATDAHVWTPGREYSIAGFGVVTLTGSYETTNDVGFIEVVYSSDQINSNATPSNGSTVTDVLTSLSVATVTNVTDIYVNDVHIIGKNNPSNGVNVDATGSMNIRFSEGLPQLDAWGKLRVSGATHLGSYVFSDPDVLATDFSKIEIQGGYVDFDGNRRSVRIGVDNASPDFNPAARARADITSHTYHHYTPGASHLFMNTVRVNDPGALNCVRRWGLYDQENGFYFQINNTAQFGVVIRSSATGAGVDVYIPQSQFNVDRMDGTGPSQTTLNLANDNIYWIDIQWHGAGRVRFGTYIDGQRIVMHEYYHGNNFQYAMSQTASLPARYVCLGEVGFNSNLYIETWSASVWVEANMDFLTIGGIRSYHTGLIPVTANVADPHQFCFVLAPPLQLENQINRKVYIPTRISAYAYDSVSGNDSIVDLMVLLNPLMSNGNFTLIPGSDLEVCNTATHIGGGREILHETFKGRLELDMTEVFNSYQAGAIKNFAQDGGTVRNNISTLTNASPAVITTSDPILLVREPQDILNDFNTVEYGGRYMLNGFTGTTGVDGQLVYIKLLTPTTAALYTDSALTVPFNTTAAGTYTGSGGRIDGFIGGRVLVGFYARTRTAFTNNTVMSISVQWKEITQ